MRRRTRQGAELTDQRIVVCSGVCHHRECSWSGCLDFQIQKESLQSVHLPFRYDFNREQKADSSEREDGVSGRGLE